MRNFFLINIHNEEPLKVNGNFLAHCSVHDDDDEACMCYLLDAIHLDTTKHHQGKAREMEEVAVRFGITR